MPDTDLSQNPDSDELADTRTAWAEDRTVLANERTFAGWMRTGMACVALALGLKAVFKDTSYPLIAKGVAEIFIIAALLIFWSAVRNCRLARERMDDHDVSGHSPRHMIVLASVLSVGAVATGIILWLL
ncbi:YidH family protein [Oceaniglobus indicus]|uniref:YidH family protein n=1 Tax=Oceaniglobus indicus TaxID=2047749 RepID=UPI000C1A8389|nr:DUF202 domain-containing protein [Oceaniglobus indicus]